MSEESRSVLPQDGTREKIALVETVLPLIARNIPKSISGSRIGQAVTPYVRPVAKSVGSGLNGWTVGAGADAVQQLALDGESSGLGSAGLATGTLYGSLFKTRRGHSLLKRLGIGMRQRAQTARALNRPGLLHGSLGIFYADHAKHIGDAVRGSSGDHVEKHSAVNVFGVPGGQNLVYPKPSALTIRNPDVEKIIGRTDSKPMHTIDPLDKTKRTGPAVTNAENDDQSVDQRTPGGSEPGGNRRIPPRYGVRQPTKTAGDKLVSHYAEELEKEAFVGLAGKFLARQGAKLIPKAVSGSRVVQAAKPAVKATGRVGLDTLGGQFAGMGADYGYEFLTGQDSPGFAGIGAAAGLGRGLLRGRAGRRVTRAMGIKNPQRRAIAAPFASPVKQLGRVATMGMLGDAQQQITRAQALQQDPNSQHPGWNFMRPIQTARGIQQGAEISTAQRLGFDNMDQMTQNIRPFIELLRSSRGQ